MVTRGEQRGADVDIEGADILVAGGRGLGKAEGFQLAEELAAAFGGNAAVAATRAVVDAGWYPYAAQIGQTGKTVSPKLYLAAGISGAIQHKVGMQSSENIVAINKDANAPIFEFSDLGIVGDLNKILPKLTEAVKAKKGCMSDVRTRLQQRKGHAGGLPAAGRFPQGVRQARPRPRGRADRGRRGDRRRRHRGSGLRQPPAAAAGRRPRDDGAPRRSPGGGRREGQDLRRAQPVRRRHAPGAAAGAVSGHDPRAVARGGLRVRRGDEGVGVHAHRPEIQDLGADPGGAATSRTTATRSSRSRRSRATSSARPRRPAPTSSPRPPPRS